MANTYSASKLVLQHYNQVVPYSNVVHNYVLYPLLLEVIKHKMIVLVILAFV
jgi:hypothetical protein